MKFAWIIVSAGVWFNLHTDQAAAPIRFTRYFVAAESYE